MQIERYPDAHASILLKDSPFEVKPPAMYQVMIYNDDFTPMDFVVEVLRIFFFKSKGRATEIMLKVHTQGKAVCGVYTKNVAETKVTQVRSYARQHEYPLRCEMMPIDS